MNSRGGDAPPSDGAEFLLQLLRTPPNSAAPFAATPQPYSPNFPEDPAIAAVGPPISTFPSSSPTNHADFPFPSSTHLPPPHFAPQNHFRRNSNPNPNLDPNSFMPVRKFNNPAQFHPQSKSTPSCVDPENFSFYKKSKSNAAPPTHNLVFGSLNRDVLKNCANVMHQSETNFSSSSLDADETAIANSTFSVLYRERSRNSNDRMKQGDCEIHRAVALGPRCLNNSKNVRHMEHGSEWRKISDRNGNKVNGGSGHIYKNDRLSNEFNSPGSQAGGNPHSPTTFDINESMKELHVDHKVNNDVHETDGLEDQILDSLRIEDESSDKNVKKNYKDYRSDNRGQWIMAQRIRIHKRQMACRNDINQLNAPLLELYRSLIPSHEEKAKQKQLLMKLEKLVCKEWLDARLFLYGSCANSFGFSMSDIDVCLQMDLAGTDKSEVLLKLANIFERDNLQNVQALTHARVPIVKLMDPVTGISGDICVNNMLAVANTKLLFTYAQIDVRLRQLAFIVKHWAKSRGVNATYQGTLSSYAYVLMCIHFLQQCRPPILPCLQRMQSTYCSRIDGVECAYFDKVEKLQRSENGESIAQLVWGFFHYWAYCHDYANDVISVRTGSTLSKRSKEWTRRVGNDRHLICIEDPLDTCHDLGRVVDKYSIRVLREEFERAAKIMQYDFNPCATLFEPYIPS